MDRTDPPIRKRRTVAQPAATELPPDPVAPEHTDFEQALRNFSLLSRTRKITLAHEVAVSRGPDLCAAYRNLLSVGSGFRRRRAGLQGGPQRVAEVCVSFVVSRKWATAGRDGDRQALPRHLLAFATLHRRRVLCAVPTDVMALAHYGRPRPHEGAANSPFGILVDSPEASDFAVGVVTCALTRPALPGRRWALSCRHVFSRTLLDGRDDPPGLPVLLDDGAQPVLARTADARGELVDRPASSFDAQLAEVAAPALLQHALGGLSYSAGGGYIRQPAEVGLGYWVATGRADASGRRLLVWVDFHVTVANFEMPYDLPDGTRVMVRHDLVLHGVAEQPLGPGDSGAPAVRVRSGGSLVGMYIGGDGRNAYVIPAWQLFTPANLGRPGESGWAIA